MKDLPLQAILAEQYEDFARTVFGSATNLFRDAAICQSGLHEALFADLGIRDPRVSDARDCHSYAH